MHLEIVSLMMVMVLYRSLNSRALKNQNNDDLPVFWRTNKKEWVTSPIFVTSYGIVLFLKLKLIKKKKNLDFKAVLVLGNAPGHPRELETMHPIIKVTFLPPNTTALLQPIDQGINKAFKLSYSRPVFKIILVNMECDPDIDVIECCKIFNIAKCIVNIKESLEELKPHKLKSCWKKLWPVLIAENEEEFVHIQTLTANKLLIEQEQELLESQDEDLTETDLLLNSQIIEEEASTSTGNVTFNLK
ncbi:tigger transposable element-derived protein 1-like [Aethina tumida]|uniref:tigger transposable element-derived protein 1-like n=1 Tax=Aethina tumida TaxID=116153 RepID=UPI0021481DDC|nr:tigger transposable element-derived protein 1-like [Aethina tumida]